MEAMSLRTTAVSSLRGERIPLSRAVGMGSQVCADRAQPTRATGYAVRGCQRTGTAAVVRDVDQIIIPLSGHYLLRRHGTPD
jgi:hypothetical protein